MLDARYGRFANTNLAECHVPFAHLDAIDIDCIAEDDRIFNPLGARGISEIGIT